MINLHQKELQTWQEYNFGKANSKDMLLGMIEENGELSHFVLKRKQGIREAQKGTLIHEICDSAVDICIFGIQLCSVEDIDVQKTIEYSNSNAKFENEWIVREMLKPLNIISTAIEYSVRSSMRKKMIGDAFGTVFAYAKMVIVNEHCKPEIVFESVIQTVMSRKWKDNPSNG